MHKYKLWQSWSEIVYYSNSIVVEANDIEEAREIAEREQNFDDADVSDSESNEGSFNIDDVEELESVKGKTKRNLPDWF